MSPAVLTSVLFDRFGAGILPPILSIVRPEERAPGISRTVTRSWFKFATERRRRCNGRFQSWDRLVAENGLTNAFAGRKLKYGDRVGIQASLVVRPPGCF